MSDQEFSRRASSSMAEVLHQEHEHLQGVDIPLGGDTHNARAQSGLALSGGGTRAAILGLGIIQGLASFGLLNRISYLSSTAGGSLIAGWLVTWMASRPSGEVQEQLRNDRPTTIEPPEIRKLRDSTINFHSAGMNGGTTAGLVWLRNFMMNILALAGVVVAFVIGAHLVTSLAFYFFEQSNFQWLGVGATFAFAAILLLVSSLLNDGEAFRNPVSLTSFSLALIAMLSAAILPAMGLNPDADSSVTRFALWSVYLGGFSLVAWFPKTPHPKVLLQHVVVSVAAGLLGGFLIAIAISWSVAISWSNPYRDFGLSFSIMISGTAISIFAYALAIPRRPSLKLSVCLRFAEFLLTAAALVMLIWLLSPISGGVGFSAAIIILTGIFISPAFLVQTGTRRESPFGAGVSSVLQLIEQTAPFVFVFGFVLGLALLIPDVQLLFVVHSREEELTSMLGTAVALLVGTVLLLKLIGPTRFTMYNFQRGRILQTYVQPALGDLNKSTDPTKSDLLLARLSSAPLSACYPLFNTSVNFLPTAENENARLKRMPFIFSPLFSGFRDASRPQPTIADLEYRPTKDFAGGLSLGTAMTVCGFESRSVPPRSAGLAFLWSVFDIWQGRWIGNPSHAHTWKKPGPPLGFLYAAKEWLAGSASEPAYVRVSGEGVESLAIFELLKRRCPFIIACDATNDPALTFDALGATIRRCRTDLGILIDIDPAPLTSKGTLPRSHCQIGHIRYPDGKAGLLLYVKPTIIGDEPGEVTQYSKIHPEFPGNTAEEQFDESTFESYRLLGAHLIQSVFEKLGDREKMDEMSMAEIFRGLRQHLQPNTIEQDSASEAVTSNLPEVPPLELVDSIASGECVLWAGSGVAMQGGFPQWVDFLGGLLEDVTRKGIIDPSSSKGLSLSLAGGEFEAVADDITHQVPRDVLSAYIQSVVSSTQVSVTHELLARMPFCGVVNTTFDELLARVFSSPSAAPLLPTDTDKILTAVQSKALFVLNTFGLAAKPASLIFTLKEFRALLSGNLQFKQLLSTLFSRSSALFIGSSLDAVRDYLEALELPNIPERRHFAIVAHAGQIDAVKLRFLERTYNLRVIAYQPQFGYSELHAFIERLQRAVAEKAPRRRSSIPLVLKSVTLQNIGPFIDLHLDLTPTWNLLLGDNGVGKTVVLRAIAAALCGEKSEPQAVKRLLRSGAKYGAIRLQVEGREYAVELKRDADEQVVIVSTSLSPLKYDHWLALGFPALRSIPLERPKGPGALQLHGPSPEDLVPILSGSPDSRIADLKQWLVNLDYASISEPQPSRSQKLLRDFFRVLQALTPDLRVELDSIDRKAMTINIRTDGGVVPLEAISQGTGSVMCWIGTLLERLAEVSDSSEPTQNTALVLIDEIDAHMHPKWQQLFVSAFREQFPNVQVIATTHSPLIVGSMKADEIWLVHRAPVRSGIYGLAHIKEPADGIREITVVGPEPDSDESLSSAKPKEQRYWLPATAELAVADGDIVEERGILSATAVLIAERVTLGELGLRADQILTSPLFNLETTRDSHTKTLMDDYTSLFSKENSTPVEKERLAVVSQQLRMRMATPHEQEAARTAYTLIQDFAAQRLKELSAAEQQKIINEVKIQLTESITGSRRPE